MDHKELLHIQKAYVSTHENAKIQNRRRALQNLENLLVQEEQNLCAAVFKDLRRTEKHTKIMELGMSLGEVRYCLSNLEEWTRPEFVEKTMAQVLDTAMVVKDPYGTCLLIAPWNYPLLMVFLPLATMLAAGNTVIIKPSELAPNVGLALQEAVAKHFDPKLVTVVLADIDGTKALLNERFDLILYTGSTNVGREIMKAAAVHLTPVVLELGGKCPVLIDKCADIPSTARRLAWGKFMNNGQTCIAPDYVLVHQAIKEELMDELKKAVKEFYGEDAQKSKDYCRIISERHFLRLKKSLDESKGKILIQAGDPDQSDLFIPPTIVDVKEDDALMKDEIFGPILPILTVPHLDDALDYLHEKEKPLALYVFSRDEKRVEEVLRRTRSGAATVNDVILHLNVDTLPFGGVGQSGFGHYRGLFGFNQFTHRKPVLKRPFFGEQLGAARYPPLTDQKFAALQMVSQRRTVPKILQRVWQNLDILLIGIIVGITALILQKA